MRRIKFPIALVGLSIMITSCLESYFPSFMEDEINTMVISGNMTDQEGFNYIYVSKATNLEIPRYIFLNGCSGYVSDQFGNHFSLESSGEGKYRFWMNKKDLIPGVKYKLYIKCPDGHEYESADEALPFPTQLDSVYANWEISGSNNPLVPRQGYQFYVDVHSANTELKYFRWIVDETWEYHSKFPMEWYFDGKLRRLDQIDYSKMICYITVPKANIFTLSTSNLTENKFIGFPLHFVPNTSEKLLYEYSVLVKQYGQTELAYKYLTELRQNIEDQGGLYERQPIRVHGNIHNISDEKEKVIGYFMATSLVTKRISFSNIENLNVDLSAYCVPWIPTNMSVLEYLAYVSPSLYPVYLLNDTVLHLADQPCFDCRLKGGSLEKPAFLP
jgi:hypothetical protein